eukprot:CAMPEP_0170201534 /NCGR_PEP_ID=MMETSP0116_2-20130129/221_1 /TAXON_ID=400756 /ORGANISM="Durinskia baltica, Strain CSIRO CS-38" /LENGTH=106 /DNA_ID=CAMNT_0010451745 /DNA_START=228 /DNA_END=548 /DNA_ORIENTATION=-
MVFSKEKEASWEEQENYDMVAKKKLVELLGAVSQISYLDMMYQKVHFGSSGGYILAVVEGNCQVNGSCHTEQNHSSVASQFAYSTIMTLEKNIEELFIRQGRQQEI